MGTRVHYPTELSDEQIAGLGDDPHKVKRSELERAQLDQKQVSAIAEGMLYGKARNPLRYTLPDGNYVDLVPQPWEGDGDKHGLENFSRSLAESYKRSVKLMRGEGIQHDHSSENQTFLRSLLNAIERTCSEKIHAVCEKEGIKRQQLGSVVMWGGYSFNVLIRQPELIQEFVMRNLLEK